MHTALLACLRGLKAKRDFVVRTAHGFGTPYAYRFAYDEVTPMVNPDGKTPNSSYELHG